MFSTQGENPEIATPWQGRASTQLLAAALAVLPLYSGTIAYHLFRGIQPLSVRGAVFYLAVMAPLAIVVVLLLLWFACGESCHELNLRPGTLPKDVLAALLLCPVIIVANVVSNFFLQALLPDAASTSVRAIFVDMAGNPGSLVLFAGPLLFLGAASEELVRVFLLSRLRKVWPSPAGALVAVVLSAGLFGMIHLYRGAVHVASAAVFGTITALYYLRYGRVVPLMLAHYATNALQVTVVAATVR